MANEKVTVIGIGYVGLPLACVLAESGFRTVGIDVDHNRVEMINSGICPIIGDEPGLPELIRKVIVDGSLKASTRLEDMSSSDAIFVCVDTPIGPDKKPRLEILISAVKAVGRSMKRGVLVSIESTLPPGTMMSTVIPLLEKESGLNAGDDFLVSHCPERVMPGKLLENMRNVDRVLGGLNSESVKRGVYFYSKIILAAIHPTDLLSAEISKTAENAYRDVQISFANEMALICEKYGADVYEIRKLVNTCPYRDMHIPGSGVGGHCLPKDSWLLISGIQGQVSRIIPLAREINDSMPDHLLDLAIETMKSHNIEMRTAKFAVMGLAFLKDSDDTRNSPTWPILDRLSKIQKTSVTVHDPQVREDAHPSLTRDLSVALTGADCAIFVTDHSIYRNLDLKMVKEWMRNPIIIDGRDLFDASTCKNQQIIYRAIGKGTVN